MHWVVAFAIGMSTAIIAFGIDSGVFFLTKAKYELTNLRIHRLSCILLTCTVIASCEHNHCVWAPLLVYLSFSMFFTFIAAALVNYIEVYWTIQKYITIDSQLLVEVECQK
jgi:hypothetical protein